MEAATVASALQRAVTQLKQADVAERLLEARMLLEHALGKSRTWILAHPEIEVSPAVVERLDRLITRRVKGEPVAYITGTREFFARELHVDARVLIPRPETEILVERVITACRRNTGRVTVIDVGTGSGAIALSIADALPNALVIASDRSMAALDVARENARLLGLEERVRFVHGNLVEWLGGAVDIIAANLPYIPSELIQQLPREVRDYEPHLALDGGPGGSVLNLKLLQQAAARLHPGGGIMLECEPDQIPTLRTTAAATGCWEDIEAVLDGFGHPRFFQARRTRS